MNETRLVESTRGAKLLEHEGFTYHYNASNATKPRKYWICVKRDSCNARCITNFDTSDHIEVFKASQHLHEVNPAEIKVQEVLRGIKRRAEDEPNAPPTAIFRAATQDADEETLMSMPERNSILRNINEIQNSKRPINPRTLAEVEITGDYTRTLNDERFLQFDSGEDDPKRILIFYTDDILRQLCNSMALFTDGTFKTAPRIFYQLFTIHFIKLDHVFPGVYCLTASKDEDVYLRIYQHLKDQCEERHLELKPRDIHCDFEMAQINAAKTSFPQVQIRCCLFHWSQSVWKYAVTQCNLKVPYAENMEIRDSVRLLLGLPFIPVQDLKAVFEQVLETIHDDVVALAQYIETYYINGVPARGRRRAQPPRYPPEIWNVYDLVLSGSHRTNNVVEGWHSRFQKQIVTHHGSIWRFIEFIKKDQRENETMITQLVAGHHTVRRPVKKIYMRNQRQILNMVKNYETYKEENEIIKYLKAVSYKLPIASESEDPEDLEDVDE